MGRLTSKVRLFSQESTYLTQTGNLLTKFDQSPEFNSRFESDSIRTYQIEFFRTFDIDSIPIFISISSEF
ncbi:hypothetical protein B2G51_09005 [Leptospira santarosai]|nr:hypothetical protein B2G51_09005 [Leptospira santarosai]